MQVATVVVGGGVAGLCTSLDLAEAGVRVVLLERRAALGGRVRTVFEGGGDTGGPRQVSYEAGAWRVDVSHARVRKVFERFGVDLVPAPSAAVAPPDPPAPPALAPTAPSQGSLSPPREWVEGGGLTTWGRDALMVGVEAADARDARSGYAGISDSAHGSDPYGAEGPFLVAPSGFSLLVERLRDACVGAGVDVREDTRVVDLVPAAEGGYVVQCRARRGGRFSDVVYRTPTVVLCLPPHAWADWSLLRKHARSLSSAVEAEVLQHVYVRGGDPPHGRPAGPASSWVVPDTGQVVAPQYVGSGWWQVSYSSGRVARLWRDYAMQDERGFLDRVREFAHAITGRPDAAAEVRRHLWPFAVHKWRAVPGFDLPSAVTAAVRVNPVRLPGVLCAGEAFSSHQGWMEGALETSELAVHAILGARGTTPRPTADPRGASEWVVYVEGARVDVRDFAAVHPGGVSALENHIGEHLDDYMMHVGHSPHAWAVVHSLKRHHRAGER